MFFLFLFFLFAMPLIVHRELYQLVQELLHDLHILLEFVVHDLLLACGRGVPRALANDHLRFQLAVDEVRDELHRGQIHQGELRVDDVNTRVNAVLETAALVFDLNVQLIGAVPNKVLQEFLVAYECRVSLRTFKPGLDLLKMTLTELLLSSCMVKIGTDTFSVMFVHSIISNVLVKTPPLMFKTRLSHRSERIL